MDERASAARIEALKGRVKGPAAPPPIEEEALIDEEPGEDEIVVDEVLDQIRSWMPQVDEEDRAKLQQAISLIEECVGGGEEGPADEEPAPEAGGEAPAADGGAPQVPF